MVNFFASLLVLIPLLSLSAEKSLLDCKSPGQSFQIAASYGTKAIAGTLKSFNQKPMVMSCQEKKYGFLCTKGDYIAKAMKDNYGRMMVQLELSGEFGPFDSGYLFTINCR